MGKAGCSEGLLLRVWTPLCPSSPLGFRVSQTPTGAEPLSWEPGVWALPVPLYSGLTLPLRHSSGGSFTGVVNAFCTEHSFNLI